MVIARIMICPDKTVLNSRFRHDYVTHTDVNNDFFMLDAGVFSGYYRSSGNGQEVIKEFTVWDDIEELRQYFTWGVNLTKDKELLPETKWTLLKDLEDDHLDALFDYSKIDWQKILWLKELQYRRELRETDS